MTKCFLAFLLFFLIGSFHHAALAQTEVVTQFEIYNAARTGDLKRVKQLVEKEGANPTEGLIQAAENGQLAVVKYLVTHGADIHFKEKRRQLIFFGYHVSALQLSIKNHHDDVAKYLITQGASLSEGLSASIEYERFSLAKFMIDQGADKQEALQLAIKRRHIELLKYTILKGADIEYKDEKGRNYYLMACEKGDLQTVQFLLQAHKFDMQSQTLAQDNALMLASKNGSVPIMEFLVQKGLKINEQNLYGKTALMFAIEGNNTTAFEYLLAHGADIHLKDTKGKDAMYYAVDKFPRHKEFAFVLHDKGMDIDQPNAVGKTMLFKAATENSLELVTALHEKGANIDPRDSRGRRPRVTNPTLIKYLVENGADINSWDDWHDTYLCVAYKQGDMELAHWLIEKGININEACYFDEPTLIKAIDKQDMPWIKFLVENEADVNVMGYFKKNALDYAMKEGNQEIIDYLKAHGAMSPAEQKSSFSRQLELGDMFTEAVHKNDTLMVNQMIKSKQKMAFTKLKKKQVMVDAIDHNNLKALDFMLDVVGFDINAPVNKHEQTLLIVATKKKRTEIIQHLKKRGADEEVRDKFFRSAKDYEK